VPLLHHGIDVRLADLSLGAAGRRVRGHRRVVAGQRRARPCERPVRLRARQGAARHGADPRRRARRPDLPARRARAADRALQERRHRPRRHAEGNGGKEERACRQDRARAALGDAGPVVAAASGSRDRLRLRLDAGARAGPPEGRRAAARHLRPRRLGRPLRHHRRDRRRRGLGHARPGGRARALVRDARHPGAAAAPVGLRGRRGGDGGTRPGARRRSPFLPFRPRQRPSPSSIPIHRPRPTPPRRERRAPDRGRFLRAVGPAAARRAADGRKSRPVRAPALA